ncbi:MAG: hypothetical protein WBH36_02590, partial [Syntrophobacteria bacterium]
YRPPAANCPPVLPVPGELALSLSKGPGEVACPACPGRACPELVEGSRGVHRMGRRAASGARAPAEKRCFCP